MFVRSGSLGSRDVFYPVVNSAFLHSMPSFNVLRLLWHKLLLRLRLESSSAWDRLMFMLRVPTSARHFTPESAERWVLYTGEFLPARIPRMVKWIRREDPQIRALLLCHIYGYFQAFANEHIDRTLLFRNTWHLKRILRDLKGKIWLVHAFAPKSEYPAVVMKAQIAPFIHDMQDVLVNYHGPEPHLRWVRHELPFEKACLAGADGVIGHCLEPRVGSRTFGIPRPHPRGLFFPLLCDNDQFKQIAQLPYGPDSIHLVYAGVISGSHRNPSVYGITQFHGLIRQLNEQGIHFHIYPSPTLHPSDTREYQDYARNYPFFHLHDSVPQDKLAQEIGQYHFGILPFYKGASSLRPDKYRYATTLKMFNFLESGIPVLVSPDLTFQHWLLSRYGVGITLEQHNLSALATLLRNLNYPTIRMQVSLVREQLSLRRRMPDLLNFYQEVASFRGK